MKKQITISELCSHLHSSYYADMAIENNTGMQPSPERIRQIAIAKLKQPQNQKTEAIGETVISATNPASEKRKGMKKNKIRILTIAAVICLMSITVFAMASGLDYFKSIFGDSAAAVKGDIQSPLLSSANDDYRITVESLLSDGYKTNMIVSLESLKGSRISDEASGLFSVGLKDKSTAAKGIGISYSCEALEEFRQGNKYFYRIEAGSLNSHGSSTIEVVLKKQEASLKIDVPVEHSTAAKEFKIDAENYENKNYRPEIIQLSPLGVLVIGSEKQAKGGLPTAEIILLMKDGSTEELMSSLSFDSNDSGDDTVVTGGGGAVIVGDGQQAPLVTQTMGERNPDGKVVTTGYFSRILDLNQVKSIVVDGTEYHID